MSILSLLVGLGLWASPPVRAARDCLAENVYYESRGEPLLGQMAVAHVTLNRVRSLRWPSTVCGVVHQKSQFSWTLDGPKEVLSYEGRAWRMAYLVADASLSGNQLDPTGGADHFHATHVSPYWADDTKITLEVGNHVFYLLNPR